MKKGFTLIELLIVIAILSILAAVVIFALNPAQKLRDARNATRLDTLQALSRCIGLYSLDDANDINMIKRGPLGKSIGSEDDNGKIFVIGEVATTMGKTIGVDSDGDNDCKTELANGGGYYIDLAKQLGSKYLSENPIDPIGKNTSAKNNANNTTGDKIYEKASTGYTLKFTGYDSTKKTYQSVKITACGSQEDGYSINPALSVTVNLQ